MRFEVVEGFPDYVVYEDGTVIRISDGYVLKHGKDGNGYTVVCLKRKRCPLHRILAKAFIPNPEDKPYIDHINTIRDNNRLRNIRWVTHLENMNNPITKMKMSNSAKGKIISEITRQRISAANKGRKQTEEWKRNRAESKKIPILQFDKDGELIAEYKSARDAQNELGIHNSKICDVLKGRQKTAGGFIWRYK